MKTRFFALAALTFALAACSNDNEELNIDGPVAAKFAAGIAPATRASGTTWDAGDRIGITGIGTVYDNVPYILKNGTFEAEGTVIYFQSTEEVVFRAYYPYQDNVASEAAVPVTLPADQSDADKLTTIDYMWATADWAASNGIINMTLNHKMSLLKLDVTDGEGFSLSEIKNMDAAILGTIPSEGTWDLTTGTITRAATGTSIGAITPYMVDNGDGTLTYYALVMPGTTFAEHSRFFQLADGSTTYSYVLNIPGGITAVESQYCNISLTVDRSGITMGTFTVGDWTPGQSGSGSVTLD